MWELIFCLKSFLYLFACHHTNEEEVTSWWLAAAASPTDPGVRVDCIRNETCTTVLEVSFSPINMMMKTWISVTLYEVILLPDLATIDPRHDVEVKVVAVLKGEMVQVAAARLPVLPAAEDVAATAKTTTIIIQVHGNIK